MANIKKEERMSYVPRTCPLCGANLDPGEQCNCLEDAYYACLSMEVEPPWEGADDGI